MAINALQYCTYSTASVRVGQVEQETVMKCFGNAGFPANSSSDDEDDNLAELQNLVSRFPQASSEYECIDDALVTEDTSLDLQDIVDNSQAVPSEDQDDNEEAENPVPPPTTKEALHYVELLQNYCLQIAPQNVDLISQLQANIQKHALLNAPKQTKINFFPNVW